MDGEIVYINAAGAEYALNLATVGVRSATGFGMAQPIHQVEIIPFKDGASYIRTTLDERYLGFNIELVGATWAAVQASRRTYIAGLNPRLGMGTIRWTPVDSGYVYEIPAILDRGFMLPIENRSDLQIIDTVSFRCPDPAWRVAPSNLGTLSSVASGMSVPTSVPTDFLDSGTGITVYNDGDLDAYPVITIEGPVNGPTIRNETTGKAFGLPLLSVSTGVSLIIDMAARTVTLDDGTNVMGYRSSESEMWAIVPGANNISAETTSGSLTATVAWDTRLVGV